MELTKRYVLIVMLAAADFAVIANTSLDHAGDQSGATRGTVNAASAQGVDYVPSHYTLNALEHVSEDIWPF